MVKPLEFIKNIILLLSSDQQWKHQIYSHLSFHLNVFAYRLNAFFSPYTISVTFLSYLFISLYLSFQVGGESTQVSETLASVYVFPRCSNLNRANFVTHLLCQMCYNVKILKYNIVAHLYVICPFILFILHVYSSVMRLFAHFIDIYGLSSKITMNIFRNLWFWINYRHLRSDTTFS